MCLGLVSFVRRGNCILVREFRELKKQINLWPVGVRPFGNCVWQGEEDASLCIVKQVSECLLEPSVHSEICKGENIVKAHVKQRVSSKCMILISWSVAITAERRRLRSLWPRRGFLGKALSTWRYAEWEESEHRKRYRGWSFLLKAM